MTDRDLASKLLIRDNHAIKLLLTDYGSFVYTVVNKVLSNSSDTEEATQDIFMKVINSISSYNTDFSFKSWLYSIAYRTAIDYLRKRKMTQSFDPIIHLVESSDLADKAITSAETKKQIDHLLSHLDVESRMIVTLFYLEEKNLKEVCLITGLQESNVKTKLFRARKLLSSLTIDKF
jgi:RNA polymerase sigma factor (sigma-70 family)